MTNSLDPNPLVLEGMDLDEWYDGNAASRLGGEAFVKTWEHVAETAIRLILPKQEAVV